MAGFALFGAIVWLAYKDTSRGSPAGEPPLIRAAVDPIKLTPDEAEESTVAEGGTVGRLWSDAERADQPERLLPLPEAPLSPPVVAVPGVRSEQPRAEATVPDSESSGDTPAGAVGDAEAALDRLLAEVAALSEEQPASPAATAPAPSEATAEPPAESAPAESAPAESPPAESPPAESAPAAAAEPAAPAPTSGRPSPAQSASVPEIESEAPSPAEAQPPAPEETTEIRRASAVAPAPAAAKPAERGSPETPPDTEAAALTPAPAESSEAAVEDRFRIQLAAVREEAAAHRAWDVFVDDLGPVLSDVQPFFERAETANGVFYRVQIGRFATQEAAESLCEELKQRNASCFVISR